MVKTWVICVEIIRKSNAESQMEVLKVQNSDYNCWNWIISYMFMWKMKMTPGLVKPQYLSFYLTKIQNQGQFWNPQNQQISKLSLLFRFGEDLMELLPKNKLTTFFVNIFTKCKKWGQFWNLLVLGISKLSLILNFCQVEAEILGLELNRVHFQFSQEYERFQQL